MPRRDRDKPTTCLRCCVILDQVDAMCPRYVDNAGQVEKRVVATCLTEMDSFDDTDARVVVVATLNRPNGIDPVLHYKLHATPSRAHDFAVIVREAGTLAIKRVLPSAPPPSAESAHLTAADLAAALPTVRPSALRAHAIIATPPVRLADTGRLAITIARLRNKTGLVRATAAESGVNFVAVRGPELLNKYIGESERGEIDFPQGAQRVSINYFSYWRAPDEIDALASSRSPTAVNTGTHEGVLLSLLNEIDGEEDAKNRPEALDPALMRPGKLDRILYLGPPDFAGLMEILRIHTSTIAVDPALDLDAIAALVHERGLRAGVTAICEEAALITIREDIDAPFVLRRAFVAAAKALKRQITPEMLQKFERWKDEYGVHSELYSRNIHRGGLHADTQYAVQCHPRKRKNPTIRIELNMSCLFAVQYEEVLRVPRASHYGQVYFTVTLTPLLKS
ncbi:P-loop containing nucleoside triphosphate hydrolase protein [Russula compacta]|nr:P-loop containing nucleoside triphosphate hydrolase protein [Russula compacta]